jgi:hypothetical protein
MFISGISKIFGLWVQLWVIETMESEDVDKTVMIVSLKMGLEFIP